MGLAVILLAEAAVVGKQAAPPETPIFHVFARITQWTTPLCWWGYILAIDALIWKLRGHSLLSDCRREFWLQLPLSVVFWLIFEVYNLHLDNWTYIGLPVVWWEEALGAIIAYATIMPGMFLTAELLATLGVFDRFRVPPFHPTARLLYTVMLLGFICLIGPVLLPQAIARYLFALVWIGFILLFEPVLYASGGISFLRDLTEGRLHRILAIVAAGYICGALWEFWNYWATAKWVYTAPFTQDIRFFEMPLAGFLGFGPFAWEFVAMYATVRLLGRVANGVPSAAAEDRSLSLWGRDQVREPREG
ncbi:MAG: hypothetical protein ACREOH_08700 [Candidatus Entotheonellia bacterium]